MEVMEEKIKDLRRETTTLKKRVGSRSPEENRKVGKYDQIRPWNKEKPGEKADCVHSLQDIDNNLEELLEYDNHLSQMELMRKIREVGRASHGE